MKPNCLIEAAICSSGASNACAHYEGRDASFRWPGRLPPAGDGHPWALEVGEQNGNVYAPLPEIPLNFGPADATGFPGLPQSPASKAPCYAGWPDARPLSVACAGRARGPRMPSQARRASA